MVLYLHENCPSIKRSKQGLYILGRYVGNNLMFIFLGASINLLESKFTLDLVTIDIKAASFVSEVVAPTDLFPEADF